MKLPKHFWNVFGVVVGSGLYILMQTQLDLLVAPYVWTNIHVREVFSLPGIGEIWVLSSRWYNLLLWVSGLGFMIALISLWFWEDNAKA